MSSKKKSLLGIFSICFIFVLAGVLFAFSISAASETEVVEPAVPEQAANEEALPADSAAEESEAEALSAEEANETSDLAEPVGGPLEVYNSAGQPATTDECSWDDGGKVYTIKANDLTFEGDGNQVECAIDTPDGANFPEVTFRNINIHTNSMFAVDLWSSEDLTLNIEGHCYINCDDVGLRLSQTGSGEVAAITGNSDSSLLVKSYDDALDLNNFATYKITGGVSINADSSNEYSIWTDASSLIFDTSGQVYLKSTRSAIWGISTSFNIEVVKGFLELHGHSDLASAKAAIGTRNMSASINLAEGMPMVGAISSTASYSDCTNGVYMKPFSEGAFVPCSLSTIGDDIIGTIFIGNPPPEPVGGPLTVLNSEDQPATTDECEWDDVNYVYTIKADGLKFKGDGIEKKCSIQTFSGLNIKTLTLDNVNISRDATEGRTVDLASNEGLTLNIINECYISSNDDGLYVWDISEQHSFTINGDSSSILYISSNCACLFSNGFKENKISGGISIHAISRNYDTFYVETNSLIFDTTGKILLRANKVGNHAIWGDTSSLSIKVIKGFLELHGFHKDSVGGAAIGAKNINTTIEFQEEMRMVGANSPTASYINCKEGVIMKNYTEASPQFSLSVLSGEEQVACTVFIGKCSPSLGPLDVYKSDGTEATADDCSWDQTSHQYLIKADGLTFKGDGSSSEYTINMHGSSTISNITFDNVKINNFSPIFSKSIDLCSNGNLTINIKNNCSIIDSHGTSTDDFGLRATSDNGGTLVLKGEDNSSLYISAGHYAFELNGYSECQIAGGLSITGHSTDENALSAGLDVENLIFNTSGKVVLYATYNFDKSALFGMSSHFKIIVKNGFLELHGEPNLDNFSAAIGTNNINAEEIIELYSNTKIVGSESPSATYAECKDGACMKYFASQYGSLSSIGESIAGTIFIGDPPPEPAPTPTPGGESSETAQTWDSVPSAAIALLAIIALSSFAVLCNRKSNK